ncbi:hypothetical protein F7R91_10415 [Streptomyces luteolifulvus]|jgi:hypothetical protein|uniref:Secreted protein n=1 Tax=Streptomyces luteolifulvus TaxID=2615112 RepID=A0A6H9V7N5_9ACTN|nr:MULTISPECIES: hypothetical protein [Streptomyces]KAB1148296.1 hypothetical protein F7R91_10415 [Streptomyces luteolifulvus]MXM66634.1 hypothetical protein [Streptomyces sp. HUCO-GS316]
MKKRSMLAIASLATGFVVAAITPSHSAGDDTGDLDVGETVSTVDHSVTADGLAVDVSALGQKG